MFPLLFYNLINVQLHEMTFRGEIIIGRRWSKREEKSERNRRCSFSSLFTFVWKVLFHNKKKYRVRNLLWRNRNKKHKTK